MSEVHKSYSEANRTARFLGLPRWEDIDELQLADCIRKGLPRKSVGYVFGQFELPKSAIYDLIPRSSFHKKGTPRLSQVHSERLFAVSKVFAEALRLYGGERAKASEFLQRPHPLLDGRSPMDLAFESTAGAEVVLKNLAKAEASVAV